MNEYIKYEIKQIAKKLADHGLIVYSGNANGADISFQIGSEGKCVVMMSYKNFNIKSYNPRDDGNALDVYDVGNTKLGNKLTDEFHPCPEALNWKSRPFINRNAHQVLGYDRYPLVSFVICCANVDNNGNVIGGTGHACSIAKSMLIPIYNLRNENDMKALEELYITPLIHELEVIE